MERTVGEDNLEVCHRIATEYATLHSVLEALLYRGDEFLRNVTTLNLVDELEVALLIICVLRTDCNDDVSELTTTTRLLLVNLAELYRLCNCLLVVNLGLTLVTLYLELALQTVDNDIEVKLTHT